MDFSILMTCIIASIWFCSGFVTGITGIGGAMLAIPVLLTILDLQTIILSACLAGIPFSMVMALYYKNSVDKKALLLMLLGSLPGALAGVWLLMLLPVPVIQAFIGSTILTAAIWQCIDTADKELSARGEWALLGGFVSGLSQTATSVGGPPIAVYATLRRWEKNMVRGTLAAFYTFSAFATVGAQWYNDLYTQNVCAVALIAAGASLVGFAISIPVGRYIAQELFRKCIIAILLLSGASMLCAAVI